MQTIEQYIATKYNNNPMWFIEECKSNENQYKVNKILNNRDYLQGMHKVLNREDITFKNETFEVRKTIFQTAKSFMLFFTGYILSKPITLGCNNEEVLDKFNKIYRKAKYNRLNFEILDSLIKYGAIYEYVYWDSAISMPKSKLINGEDGFPIYSEDTGDYIAFIEHYTVDSSKISYWNVYFPNEVLVYNNEGGYPKQVNSYPSYGLPILYEYTDNGNAIVSLLDDIKPLLDEYEFFLNKFGDSIETNSINPILTQTGGILEIPKSVSTDATGFVVHLDNGSEMKYVSSLMDADSIKLYVSQLQTQMCDISCVPSVLYGQTDIANISETSIKLLYGKSDNQSTKYKYILEDGFDTRHDIIMEMLNINTDDYITTTFNINLPTSDTDVISNLSKQYNDGAIDKITYIEKSPLTDNVKQVLERLDSEAKSSDSVVDNNVGSKVDDNMTE